MARGQTIKAEATIGKLRERLPSMHLVDPLAGEIHQHRDVAPRSARLGFELAHFAARSRLLLW